MAHLIVALWLAGCGGDGGSPSVPVQHAAAQREVRTMGKNDASAFKVPYGETALGLAPAGCPEGMLPVPGGRFVMGQHGTEAGSDERTVHLVRLDGFCMDRTEVTKVGETTPWVGLSFNEAVAACGQRGARLPTEAEWEKTARGGCELGGDPLTCTAEDVRIFPWGNETPTCGLANHSVVGPRGPKRCSSGPTSVDQGGAGAGPYGHLHLAGNAWEYVLDFYHPRAYRVGRVDNPMGPPSGESRVLRGGAWDTFSTNMRVSNRFNDSLKGSTIGFRCVAGGAEPVVEELEPLAWVQASVIVRQKSGQAVSGRWLTVSAFDMTDISAASGLPEPGRSPVAEAGVAPDGTGEVEVKVRLPKGAEVRFSAALDNGSAPPGMPAAASGGIAWSAGNQVLFGDQKTPIILELAPLPAHPHSPRP
jgi:formylglycine-generating enzyme required for sulfatase activity